MPGNMKSSQHNQQLPFVSYESGPMEYIRSAPLDMLCQNA